MLDQNKIKYNKVDLEKINKSQPIIEDKPKKQKRWCFSFFYNIFNKSFKFNFKWRF